MAVSSFHMLAFSLLNPYSLSFDRDGPFPALYRLLTTRSPSIYTLDLSSYTNKTILITGATSGCGLECAKGLARAGCCLLFTTRDPHRGEAVQKEIQHEANLAGVHTKVNMLELDMASFKSIATFMSQLKGVLGHGHGHLDIAILNAGVYQTGFQVCPETGLEKTIQVNFLATCALSILLHPHLSHSKEGRILFISSEAHAWANPKQSSTHLLLEHLNNPTSDEYSCYQRYHISKLLLVLWGRELSSRREWNAVSVASVSPGFTRSKLFREFNSSVVARALEYVVCRSSEQGASQYILALEDLIEGKGKGGFWSDGGWRWPSTPTTCTSGRVIRTTLYADVMGALKELGEMEELLDPGHSLK